MNNEALNQKQCFNIQYLNFSIVWDLGFHYLNLIQQGD
jgi:hypothetical protein